MAAILAARNAPSVPSIPPLSLGAALKRGAVLVMANWPVMVIDFTLESFYKLALAVPILGGALMVATVAGTDLGSAVGVGADAGSTLDTVVGSLGSTPVALVTFLVALAIAAVGGLAVMFIAKMGTLTVIVDADRSSGEVQTLPIGADALRRASAFRLERVLAGARQFARRAVTLALWLGGAYVAVGAAFVAVISSGLAMATGPAWTGAWPVLVLLTTSVGAVVISGVNLAYDLLRVIIVTDDCPVRLALVRLRHFVVDDAPQVIGIASVIGGVQIVAAAAALLAAAGLAPIAYMPLISLVLLPLQAALWILRGLVFESMSLASVAAYQTQYRRFSDAGRAAPPSVVAAVRSPAPETGGGEGRR